MKRNILLAFFVLLIQTFCFGQQGMLDPSFGNGGKVITAINNADATAYSVAVKSNGKIIVGGTSKLNGANHFTLAQYTTDGLLDTAFGANGIVVTKIKDQSEINNIALQPDGKILAGGNSRNNVSSQTDPIAFTIARYNTNGSLDTSFGDSGVVVTAFQDNFAYPGIKKIIVKPSGKILVGGGMSDMVFEYHLGLAQYLPTGRLDSTFGTNGKIITGVNVVNGKHKGISDMALTANGKIVVAIEADPVPVNNQSDFLIVRLMQDGSYDNSFANNGFAQTDFNNSGDLSYSVAVLPDSSIVSAGYFYTPASSTQFALAKYLSNGVLDNGFGSNGKVITPIGSSPALANNLIVQNNGNIIITGHTFYTTEDFAVAKYNSNGTLNNSFGNNGIITTDFLGYKDESFSSALQSDGKLVVAGRAKDNSKFNIALVRYLNDVLPLKLLSFAGAKRNKTVLLQWQTAQEQNTNKFIIERSTDQRNYSSVGSIAATRYSTSTTGYSFTDREPLEGTNLYLLKMVDNDGKFTYSNVVSISMNTLSNNLRLYPNPANDKLQIQIFGENEAGTLQIKDATGKVVKGETVKLNRSHIFSVDIHTLPKGKYYAVFEGKSIREIAEFVKL